MNSFKPTIVSTGMYSYTGTMPHSVRSATWSVLFKLQDNVVKLDSNETQLHIKANPGYEKRDVLVLLATAVYISINTVDELLAITSKSAHADKLNSSIAFAEAALTGDEIAPYIGVYLSAQVKAKLDNAIDITSANPKYVSTRRDQVGNAKRLLEFAPITTISPWEKSKRLKLCTETLVYIDQFAKDLEKQNKAIDRVKQNTKDEIARIMTKWQRHPVSWGKALANGIDYIRTSNATAKVLFEELDFANLEIKTQYILDITPAAPLIHEK